MPGVKLDGHVASMRRIFEQQSPKDAAKDTLVNECNSLNSNLNFLYSLLDGKDSKRPEKQTLTETPERRDPPPVYGKREGFEAIYDKLNPLEKSRSMDGAQHSSPEAINAALLSKSQPEIKDVSPTSGKGVAPEIALSDINVSECAQSINELTEYQLGVIETTILAYKQLEILQPMERKGRSASAENSIHDHIIASREHLAELKKTTEGKLAEIKQDRNAHPDELMDAAKLRKEMLAMLTSEYQKMGIKPQEAKKRALVAYNAARTDTLNNAPWKTIQREISHNGNQYSSLQRPAAEMKLGDRDIFPTAYQGKGICSSDANETKHAANLWQSSLSVEDQFGQQQTLFQGIRHGVLSPFALPARSAERIEGAQNRAKEVVTAALYSRPELMARALKGETVPLQLVSTSLLTPTKISIFGKEREMLRDQMQAWQTLCKAESQRDGALTLTVHNDKGEAQDVKVALDVAAFNFGVNEFSLKLGLGNDTSDSYNAVALNQLLGNDLRPEAEPGGWVGRYLEGKPTPENANKVITLSKQLKNIWNGKLYRSDGGEPYKTPQRLMMLAYEIGAVPCWNCKSGKDRTGMLDAEVKREAIAYHNQQPLKDPQERLNEKDTQLLQTVVLQSGNLEVQKQNTGVKGNKVAKTFKLSSMNLSLTKRLGLGDVWSKVKGLAQFAKSSSKRSL
ncbi:inositol phosphate phosphatase SopB [Sodalis praecaptivus]|uniref:inositol phosphate phosphatase SopB n=1 Tax=Sodalis praecaptivus TaxID=1239307 RepID=UPI0027F35BD4|nr:inositol phosphate phosphatase SopB [Sodalis praecaptivus]CAJ0993664.1 hypothetical protein NVIRENTERO_01039 [Sodalis praecaptivus]